MFETHIGPDPSRPVAASRDSRYSLTIEAAAELYAQGGHPRTLRTIQRYCASGHLDSIKIATAIGDKYLIDPTSLDRHVAQIEELARLDFGTTGRDTPRPAATDVAAQPTGDTVRHAAATRNDMSPPVAADAGHGASEAPRVSASSSATTDTPDLSRPVATEPTPVTPPVAAVSNDTSRYVAGLEREVERLLEDREFAREQIRTKDHQIASLLERDRETNILVRGLQQMLTPLLGRPQHDRRQDGTPEPDRRFE